MLQYQAVLCSCHCMNTRMTWNPWQFNFCSYSEIHEKWIHWRNYSGTNVLFRNIFVVFHLIAYCTGDTKISMGFNAPNEYKDKFFPSPWSAKFQLCTKTLLNTAPYGSFTNYSSVLDISSFHHSLRWKELLWCLAMGDQ